MRKFTWVLALALPVSLVSCQKEAVRETAVEEGLVQGAASTGNGAPSGAHYTLNIIGVPKGKTAAMDNNNGSRSLLTLTVRPISSLLRVTLVYWTPTVPTKTVLVSLCLLLMLT